MIKNFLKKKTVVFFLSLLVISGILEISFRISPSFSEFYSITISPFLRLLYVPLSLIPFAVSETLILTALLMFLSWVVLALIKPFFIFWKKDFPIKLKSLFFIFLKTGIIVFFLFTATFSSSYHRQSLSQTMGLEIISPTRENLILATEKISEKLNEISSEIPYTHGTMSSYGTDFKTLSKEIKKAALKTSEKHTFLKPSGSLAKPIALSSPMTYTHIAGIYTFFTGEPCVNTNYAEYTIPFTMAHEYAHQCGIGREDAADFTAYLICENSTNSYVKYSALAETFIILSNELYILDPDAYYNVLDTLPPVLFNDFMLESSEYSKYSDSVVGEVASNVNDVYLKANGVESGVNSYKESVVLLVSYLNQN